MGRGSLYRYEHYMLFNPEEKFTLTIISCRCCNYQEILQGYTDTPDSCPRCGEKTDISYEFDEYGYEDFKNNVITAFKADIVQKWIGREAYIFGETHNLEIGIDSSGGLPALFAKPKKYYHNKSYEEKEYIIDKIVKKAFNKLIKEFENMFSRPTSAWITEPIKQY